MVNQVLQSNVGEMTHYNIPSLLVEYWSYVYQLNGALVELVNFLVVDYRSRHRMLNLLAQMCKHNKNNASNKTNIQSSKV